MIRSYRFPFLCALVLLICGCFSEPGANRLQGDSVSLGDGTVYAFVDMDDKQVPIELGVIFSASMLEGLPQKPNRTSRCFDLDGDGEIADMGECDGDEERILWLPDDVRNRADIPFKYVMLNWNPMGHGLPAPPAWAEPHFDFHFYIQALEDVDTIRTGNCGFFLDCDDFERAMKPVPAKYVHPDQISVGAAVPRMGNHLIDSKSPELVDATQKFQRTWIIGAYDGHVTFWEPMITLDYIASRPDSCVPIRQPEAFEVAGYYPTSYCVNFNVAEDVHRISLQGFEKRSAG